MSINRLRTLLGIVTLCAFSPLAVHADIVNVTVINEGGSAENNAPVTFGHVFSPGHVPSGSTIGARLGNGTEIPVQADLKATHRDNSIRHAIITAEIPSIGGNGSEVLTLFSKTPPGGSAVTLNALLNTSFDAVISIDIGGTVYTASARDALQGNPEIWLQGPLVSEWTSRVDLTDGGNSHPHLSARFNVRAFAGLNRVRVSAIIENTYSRVTGPRRYSYDLTVTVDGQGTVLTDNLTHYRQSRWRRIFWWGDNPQLDVEHDSTYLMATGSVPTYSPDVTISNSTLNSMVSSFNNANDLMDVGNLDFYMPSPGGRREIAPLPRFAARWIISQDLRAKEVMVGHGEQAGAWPMHYRDRDTDLPMSLDTYPNMTIVGDPEWFPACGGNCSSPYTAEMAHHPSLAYVPYLVTGDHYLLEEMQFWGNWAMFYGPDYQHGYADGLVVWDQVRGQAWGLRSIAQAAYATPDGHPLKSYFESKLQNNITYFLDNWVDSNPLGYITNTGEANWLGLQRWISTWMDDFLTWSFGHIVALGYEEARPVLEWKAKFPVGRLTDPDMCWTLASTSWPTVRDDFYLGGPGNFVDTWQKFREILIWSWDNDAIPTSNIAGREQDLINAECNSQEMANILGESRGSMISYVGPDGYAANLQPAAAVAVEAGLPNAQAAFDRLVSATNFPGSEYNVSPQWAVVPAASRGPAISLSANPLVVAPGTNSTLNWDAPSANNCSASGGWTGGKNTSGSESVGPLSNDTTFNLSCTNNDGTTNRAVTVTVQSSTPAPTMSLSANAQTIDSGDDVMLNWSSQNADSCQASGAWNGNRNASGSETVGPLTSDSSFTLQCSGGGGSVSRTVSVTVVAPPNAPTLSLTATDTSIDNGDSTTLNWSTTNVDSCSASGGWNGSRNPSGSEDVGPLTSNTTYTLNCSGSGGDVSTSVTISVAAAPPPPPPVPTPAPDPVDEESTGAAGFLLLLWLTGTLRLARSRQRRAIES